jgi:Domain of unknown function (DUF4158)
MLDSIGFPVRFFTGIVSLLSDGVVTQGWQSTFLSIRQLPKELSAFELQAFFTFSNVELELIQERRAATHKLGLALHIWFLRLSGRLLDAKRIVSAPLWRHLGAQLGVARLEMASLKALYERRHTHGAPTHGLRRARIHVDERTPAPRPGPDGA